MPSPSASQLGHPYNKLIEKCIDYKHTQTEGQSTCGTACSGKILAQTLKGRNSDSLHVASSYFDSKVNKIKV